MSLAAYLDGLDDFDSHLGRYIVSLCHLFPSLSPWNVYDLELRHYLAFTRAVDEREREARRSGG